MRRVKILKPRLDVAFKKGPVPKAINQNLPPIREHWRLFVDNLYFYHQRCSDDVKIIEKPLWQFDEQYVTDVCNDNDVVYMPHKQKRTFKVPSNCWFYMQTVFPHLFTIDKQGWGANLSWAPVEPLLYQNFMDLLYYKMRDRINENISKFDQPEISAKYPYANEEYYLFICQLPHDETIKYHSDVEVIDALTATLEWGKKYDKKIVVKGHPINPASMGILKDRTKQYDNAVYIDKYSIHQCIKHSTVCLTVNSGAGIEVILHNKPLITFGRSEYSNVVPLIKATVDDIDRAMDYKFKSNQYISFIHSYIRYCVDSSDALSYFIKPIGAKLDV